MAEISHTQVVEILNAALEQAKKLDPTSRIAVGVVVRRIAEDFGYAMDEHNFDPEFEIEAFVNECTNVKD